MKKIVFLIIIFLSALCSIDSAFAEIYDPNSGGSGSVGGTGSGGWNDTAVGLKVTILNSNGGVKDIDVFTNGQTGKYFYGRYGNTEFSVHTDINFIKSLTDWNPSNKIINFYNILSSSSYYNLKTMINSGYLNVTNGDYIIVEPMAKVNGYFATAYELAIAFEGKGGFSCVGGTHTFNWCYNKALFKNANSIFFNTIYLNENVTIGSVQINKASGTSATVADYKNKNYGRGIGVFSYDVLYPNPKYTLTINKTDIETGIKIPNLRFDLINSGGTTIGYCDTNWNGTCSISGITSGTYTLIETVPNDYAPNRITCDRCSRVNGSSMTVNINGNVTLNITNEKDCSSELRTGMSKSELVNLYKKYGQKGLLNFESPSCTNNIEPKYSNNSTCLYASSVPINFREGDLSGFFRSIVDKNYAVFCGRSFEFSNIYGYTAKAPYNFGTFKSGQMVLSIDSGEVYIPGGGKIATGQVRETCYVFGSIDSLEDIDYSSVLGKVNFNNETLIEIKENSQDWVNTYTSEYVKKEKILTTNYYLNPVFSFKGSGDLTSNKDCTNCIFLGFGFASNLNTKKSNKIEIPFSIMDSKNNVWIKNNDCVYNIEEEIITDDTPTNKEQLNFEFRSISTKSAFPGKSATGRTVGSNWCTIDMDYDKSGYIDAKDVTFLTRALETAKSTDIQYDINRDGIADDEDRIVFRTFMANGYNVESNDCSSENALIKYIMDTTNDSYNKNYRDTANPKDGVLYSIELTPDDVKTIREYNRKTTYDDYTLTCNDKGLNCTSTFLSNLETGELYFDGEYIGDLSSRLIR